MRDPAHRPATPTARIDRKLIGDGGAPHARVCWEILEVEHVPRRAPSAERTRSRRARRGQLGAGEHVEAVRAGGGCFRAGPAAPANDPCRADSTRQTREPRLARSRASIIQIGRRAAKKRWNVWSHSQERKGEALGDVEQRAPLLLQRIEPGRIAVLDDGGLRRARGRVVRGGHSTPPHAPGEVRHVIGLEVLVHRQLEHTAAEQLHVRKWVPPGKAGAQLARVDGPYRARRAWRRPPPCRRTEAGRRVGSRRRAARNRARRGRVGGRGAGRVAALAATMPAL